VCNLRDGNHIAGIFRTQWQAGRPSASGASAYCRVLLAVETRLALMQSLQEHVQFSGTSRHDPRRQLRNSTIKRARPLLLKRGDVDTGWVFDSVVVRNPFVRAFGAALPVSRGFDPLLVEPALVPQIAADCAGGPGFAGNPDEAVAGRKL
jgi:hypothetical protein